MSHTPLLSRGQVLNKDTGKASLDAEDKTEAVEIRAARGKLKVTLWHPIAFYLTDLAFKHHSRVSLCSDCSMNLFTKAIQEQNKDKKIQEVTQITSLHN